MNSATIRDLLDINLRFYERFAAAFAATREAPWPGWDRVLHRLADRHDAGISVLDVGCGNGRFGSYLTRRWPRPIHYSGLDACEALLAAAADRLEGEVDRLSLARCEILGGGLERPIAAARYDLVTVFAVLHHLPGAENRIAVIRRLAAALRPAGLLAVSTWRLDRRPGDLEKKVLPWEMYNRRRQRNIDFRQLEPGDLLLTWGGDRETPRYCHFPSEEEIRAWIDASGLRLVDRFDADGAGGADNLYLIFEP